MYAALVKRQVWEVSMTHEGFCKTVERNNNEAQLKVPSSWDLNKLQRGFIESMFEDKNLK
ncbi:hypothetical protein EPYR_01811 [Erwinia pyrifoliae DSM 12163]|nr:AraC family transcriptional regulator [Erwinia pyrifoliae]MCA8876908.1 AraC family transcriptional regulator [Erwinia pyrifoliae]CAX55462.1 conservede uncharacterized protein [Erwinia pyrifoliae Ep1/96]CAY74191.1 hypothetical protein EPYR_01811 [Erwinia pyrifoliae DSM 12163]